MSEDYLAQQQPTLTWNSARGVWEKAGIANLLCEHWELFSETWPTSGIMRNGQVFELPTPAHRTTDSESLSSPTQVFGTVTTATSGRSPEFRKGANPNPVEFAEEIASKIELLRSPTASQGEGGALGEEEARKRGNTVGIRDQAMVLAKLNGERVSREQVNLMPTPQTMDTLPARDGEARERQLRRGGSNSRRTSSGNLREDILQVLPTPTTRDYKDGSEPHERDGVVQTDTVARAVFNSGEVLLPTTRTSMANGPTQKELDAGNPKHRIETVTNWGKFEPAIRRWEETLGRPAPAPTRPDGKDGAHRLSPEFTEFMMGVPEGWITDCGLTRNEELKACGNGVVPQQAALALRVLLEGVELEVTGRV